MQIRTEEGTSKLQPRTTIHKLPSLLSKADSPSLMLQ